MYKDNWTQPWPMGLEIYPKVHENPRAFFRSSSPILLESIAHGSSDWSLPREDCLTSSSVNGEGSTPKDPLYKILDELRSLKLWKDKQERKDKGKKKVEEISQDEKEKISEEERRKILKELRKEKHVSYSSHNSCIGHILDLTPIGDKRKESLKRLTLTSHNSMGRTM